MLHTHTIDGHTLGWWCSSRTIFFLNYAMVFLWDSTSHLFIQPVWVSPLAQPSRKVEKGVVMVSPKLMTGTCCIIVLLPRDKMILNHVEMGIILWELEFFNVGMKHRGETPTCLALPSPWMRLQMPCDKLEEVWIRSLWCLRLIKDSTLEETAERFPAPECDGPLPPRFGGQNHLREANFGNDAPTWPNLQSTGPGRAGSFCSSAMDLWFQLGPNTIQHTSQDLWTKRSAKRFPVGYSKNLDIWVLGCCQKNKGTGKKMTNNSRYTSDDFVTSARGQGPKISGCLSENRAPHFPSMSSSSISPSKSHFHRQNHTENPIVSRTSV